MGLAERIKEAMGNLSAADLARATGKTPGAVTQWLDGTTKSLRADTATLMEVATGYRAAWIVSGAGPKKAQGGAGVLPALQGSGGNVAPIPGRGGVPLISWVQAGTWNDIEDNFQPGEADDWLPCPVKHGPRAYCLRVRGDSMLNPEGKPSYSDGDIIFVDPDRAGRAGDRVVVRLDDAKQTTFKQLMDEDGRMYLKALNPDWKPRYIELTENATICGVVIGKWVPE